MDSHTSRNLRRQVLRCPNPYCTEQFCDHNSVQHHLETSGCGSWSPAFLSKIWEADGNDGDHGIEGRSSPGAHSCLPLMFL